MAKQAKEVLTAWSGDVNADEAEAHEAGGRAILLLGLVLSHFQHYALSMMHYAALCIMQTPSTKAMARGFGSPPMFPARPPLPAAIKRLPAVPASSFP
eukprot:5386899-Lingulodinium_polyedra.AAC.1